MASQTVRVFVEDQSSDPIEDVLVRVFNAAGDSFISEDFTDVSGIADFTLDGDDPPNEYTIRLSKTGVAFDGALGDDSKSPQLIEVWTPAASSPSSTNDFTVQGETFTRPTATDLLLCRCSGFFKRGDGQPYANLDINFTPLFRPTIVEENGVMGGVIVARTDEDGYIEIDLYRNGEYSASIETLGDCVREMVVPDLSSANIVDLLFTVVEEVVFAPTSLAMSVDDQETAVPTVTGSDGRTLEGAATDDVEYTSSDTAVATIAVTADQIVVTAVAAGSAQIDVARRDESIVLIPDGGITHTPLPITVT